MHQAGTSCFCRSCLKCSGNINWRISGCQLRVIFRYISSSCSDGGRLRNGMTVLSLMVGPIDAHSGCSRFSTPAGRVLCRRSHPKPLGCAPVRSFYRLAMTLIGRSLQTRVRLRLKGIPDALSPTTSDGLPTSRIDLLHRAVQIDPTVRPTSVSPPLGAAPLWVHAHK